MAASCRELAGAGLARPATASSQPGRSRNELCFAALRQEERGHQGRSRRRGVKVVAAVSEELPRLASAGKGAGRPPPPQGKVALRAALTVRRKQKEDLKEAVAGHLDALWDMVGRGVVLELISTKIDPNQIGRWQPEPGPGDADGRSNNGVFVNCETVIFAATSTATRDAHGPVSPSAGTRKAVRSGGASIKDWCAKRGGKGEHVVYTAEFTTTGELPGDANRVFFSNKPYLPSQTPPGLREIREKVLRDLRGDGTGVRKISDQIYDYAMYNDLGNPDRGKEFIRPILGGDKIPYPRRCRTGRPPTDTNMLSESRVEKPHRIYVPRDETFEELKQGAFISGRLRAVLHTLIPSLIASISADTHNFQGFHHVDNLYKEGLRLKLGLQEHLFQKIPFVQKIQESSEGMLRYDTPSILSKDKFAWLRDDEFARQTIAGINPVSIERLKVFPPVSKLDPAMYGPPESSITERHISGQLNGLTVQEAIDKEKLFIVDHHDVYMPFLDRINAIEGRKAYATRAIFFLTQGGTLKPIAIELSLPPAQSGEPQPSKVLTPACDATSNWIWMLGKAHVSSNDAGVHQLVNHWLRTHAIMEPFILAAHRRMSAMHPIFKLLHPHMRYTLEINALARQSLINAEGVIESCFTPGPVSGEISSAYYRNHWRFDLEGLPADLLRRHVPSTVTLQLRMICTMVITDILIFSGEWPWRTPHSLTASGFSSRITLMQTTGFCCGPPLATGWSPTFSSTTQTPARSSPTTSSRSDQSKAAFDLEWPAWAPASELRDWSQHPDQTHLLFVSKHAFLSLPFTTPDPAPEWTHHRLPREASVVTAVIDFRGRILGIADRAELLEFVRTLQCKHNPLKK
uniref:Lipoxygenase n=1 Tax=Aegilops tauschii TaxID=37682 RepID=M8BF56_AEGTA